MASVKTPQALTYRVLQNGVVFIARPHITSYYHSQTISYSLQLTAKRKRLRVTVVPINTCLSLSALLKRFYMEKAMKIIY